MAARGCAHVDAGAARGWPLFPADVTPARCVRFYAAFSGGAAAGDRAGGDADGEGEGRDADAAPGPAR